MAPVGEVSDSVVENFEKNDPRFYWFQIFNAGYLIGRGNEVAMAPGFRSVCFFKLQTVPVYSERTDSSIFSSF